MTAFVATLLAYQIPEASTAMMHGQQPFRDPFLQPFSSTSLWNTSLGGAARWSRIGDPDTVDLLHGRGTINSGSWSMPYYLGRPSDPIIEFVDRDQERPLAPQRLKAPPNVHAALPPDGDNHIIIFDKSKRHMFHYFGCKRENFGFGCVLAQRDDTCSDGLGMYGWGTGVIRRWELEAGDIRHMLRFSLPFSATKSGVLNGGQAWPATGEDYVGPQKYYGHVLFGSTIGIPGDVDIETLHLSSAGMVLAKALQDYGAMQRDTGGTDGIILYAEEAAEGLPQLADMRNDLPKIVPHLRILRNQSASSPNGGGVRRLPSLPPVDPKVCKVPS